MPPRMDRDGTSTPVPVDDAILDRIAGTAQLLVSPITSLAANQAGVETPARAAGEAILDSTNDWVQDSFTGGVDWSRDVVTGGVGGGGGGDGASSLVPVAVGVVVLAVLGYLFRPFVEIVANLTE